MLIVYVLMTGITKKAKWY